MCSKGSLEISNDRGSITINEGDFCLEETVLNNSKDTNFDVKAKEDSEVYIDFHTRVFGTYLVYIGSWKHTKLDVESLIAPKLTSLSKGA